MDMKTAAEKLLNLSEKIEKQASDSSYFICDRCYHTANLTTINDRRKKAAFANKVAKVKEATVNDKVSCPACEGSMSYVETADSRRFYVEAADDLPMLTDETPPEDTPPEDVEKTPEEDTGEIPPVDETAPEGEPAPEGETTPEDIFKPVDEQEKEQEQAEGLDLSFEGEEPATDEVQPTEGEQPMEKEKDIKEVSDGGVVPEGEMPAKDEDVPEVVEEEVPEEGKKPGRRKKEEVEFPKKETPKFEKMTKEASDFERRVAKYLM